MTKTERRIGQLVKKYRDLFGINPDWEFAVKVYYDREECPKKERHCAAWITNDSAYLRSVVSFNMFHQECKDDLESVVCHELTHVLLEPVDTIVSDAIGEKYPTLYRDTMESLTTRLELAFKKMRKR